MKYMRGPDGKIKPILEIYVELYQSQGWVLLEGQELKDHEMEEAYKAALRVRARWLGGAVSSRKLTKAEEAAIAAWEARVAELAAKPAEAEAPAAV